MKKYLISFLLLLSFALSASAQKLQQQKPDITEQNLRTHVAYLASDGLEGRRTGETGATNAAGYVANIFTNYKLTAGVSQTNEKGKTSKNYLQSFPFVTGVEAAQTGNEFKLSLKISGKQETTIEDSLSVKSVEFSPNAEVVNAPIVFVGYGIVSGELKYDDYADLDVKGKVILAFDGTPEDSPQSPFARFNAMAKALIAKEKGAVGLLLISREAKLSDDRIAQFKYDQTLGEAALPTFIISRNTAQKTLGITEKDLKTAEDVTALKKDSALNIKVSFRDTQPVVSFKINLVKKQAVAYNVIGILEGKDAQLKNEAIIIGAHYDHLGHGGQGSLAVNSTEIHHGADDNASGVAAMLELARQFAKEKNNKRTLIFIAFGGEEEGLLGSKFYVNNPVFPLDKTVAMINMDMVGRLRDDKLTVGGIGTASEWKNLIEIINPKEEEKIITVGEENLKLKQTIQNALIEKSLKNVQVEVKDNHLFLYGAVPKGKTIDAIIISQKISGKSLTNNISEENNRIYFKPFSLQLNEDGFGPSDHSSFYGKQIPVLFFFTGSHEDYHKPTDTADKINYEGLLKIENFVSDIVKAVDENPKRPTYTVAKSSGTGEGRRGFNVSLGTVPSYAEGTSDGLLLDGVRDDSPAAKAGILAGDKIVKMAGREIRNISDYVFVLGEMKAGEEYEIIVLRGGQQLTLKIIPAARR